MVLINSHASVSVCCPVFGTAVVTVQVKLFLTIYMYMYAFVTDIQQVSPSKVYLGNGR